MAWLSTTATVSMKPATLDYNVVTSPPMYASSVDSINRPLVHQYQPNQAAALKHAAQAAAKRISFPNDAGDRLAVSPGMCTIRVVPSIFGLALASPSHIDHSTVFQLGESQRQLRSMKGNLALPQERPGPDRARFAPSELDTHAADAAGSSSGQVPLVAPLAPHRYLVRFFPLGV